MLNFIKYRDQKVIKPKMKSQAFAKGLVAQLVDLISSSYGTLQFKPFDDQLFHNNYVIYYGTYIGERICSTSNGFHPHSCF